MMNKLLSILNVDHENACIYVNIQSRLSINDHETFIFMIISLLSIHTQYYMYEQHKFYNCCSDFDYVKLHFFNLRWR